MTDRIHSLTVVLEQDIRDDDVQPIIDAIRMVRRVADVRTHVTDVDSHMAVVRAYSDLSSRVLGALREMQP